ncbi:MAG: FHA domain-containing protein [bacterium]|nr:FHA domain-containing protein [bacterium]
MDADQTPLKLAKVSWVDPDTGINHEHVLTEGATATIGRSSSNDICIPEQHVSRQHAVINYRDGVFVINDLNSANGTFVNDQQVQDAYPLFSGDKIRLYVPVLTFSAAVSEDDQRRAEADGRLITATISTGQGYLIITSGPQEGHTIPLLLQEITVGRATANATWEIGLQDPSVSRPHARLRRIDNNWVLYDLGSANGTTINSNPVNEKGRALHDGDVVTMGATMMLYRAG